MDTKTVNMPERTRDTVTSHGPKQSVQRTRLLAEEIPGRVVGCRGLRDFIVASGLDGVNQVWEENSILDEKDRDVIADKVWDELEHIVKRGREREREKGEGGRLTYRSCPRRYRSESQSREHHGPSQRFPGSQQRWKTG